MDDVEYQFTRSLAKTMSDINRTMTDGKSSKYTGFGGQRNEELARRLVREGKSRGDVAGSTSPVYQPDNMDTNLKPMEITPDMIREIRELEGDVILPEYANRKNVMGNPSQVSSKQMISVPQYVQNTDPNQLEMDFDKITVDHIHEQYQEVLKEFHFLKKELQTIKGLLEIHLNNE